MMIDFQYAEATYGSHRETINLIKTGDSYRYGRYHLKDEVKAFRLYSEVEGMLNSFKDRCVGLSPYIHMRMCECYLYGIGTDKNLLEAFCSLVSFVHFLRSLPFIAKLYNAKVDPNFDKMESFAKVLLADINKEFAEYGFVVSLGDNFLRVFSKFRVPFQINRSKQPECVLLKTVIQRALIYFPALFHGADFHARYGTTDAKKAFYDLENVVFYNLDLAAGEATKRLHNICFSGISQDEIARKKKDADVAENFSHLYEYFADSAPYSHDKDEVLVAQWRKQPFCSIRSTCGVLEYWEALKKVSDQIEICGCVNTEKKEKFSLYLEIETPKNRDVKILSVLKPFLDAIISALHGGDFSEEEVCLFAEKLGVPPSWITNFATNILGDRQYIQCYPSKSGIKWNPADDLCGKVCVSVVQGESWKLSGSIYKMEHKTAASTI